jgi:hypothetical protein
LTPDSELSARGFNAQYATGSRAFTRTLQRIVGRRAGQQFKYFNNCGSAEEGVVDLLICDESHRIRASSNHQYTQKENRSTKPQIQELIDASKVSVFFIDDRQIVRPGEVGSSQSFGKAQRRTVAHWRSTSWKLSGPGRAHSYTVCRGSNRSPDRGFLLAMVESSQSGWLA